MTEKSKLRAEIISIAHICTTNGIRGKKLVQAINEVLGTNYSITSKEYLTKLGTNREYLSKTLFKDNEIMNKWKQEYSVVSSNNIPIYEDVETLYDLFHKNINEVNI
jgi:hypothetical protein